MVSVAKSSATVIQLMASLTLMFFYLMLFVHLVTKKIAGEIEHMYRLHHHLCSAVQLD